MAGKQLTLSGFLISKNKSEDNDSNEQQTLRDTCSTKEAEDNRPVICNEEKDDEYESGDVAKSQAREGRKRERSKDDQKDEIRVKRKSYERKRVREFQ